MHDDELTERDYGPRSRRKSKDKFISRILVVIVLFVVIIGGLLYSLYGMDTGKGEQQLASAGNEQAGEEQTQTDEPQTDETAAPANPDSTLDDQTDEGEALPAEEQGSAANPEESSGTADSPAVDDTADETVTDAGAASPSGGSQQAANSGNGTSSGKAAVSTSSSAKKFPTSYVVRKGDTLSTISQKFYQSKAYVSLLAEKNNIVFINDLKVGSTITIPAPTSKSGTNKGDADYSKVALPASYLVRSGDTLYQLSMQFYRSKDYVDLIADTNKLDKSEALEAGMILTIPALPKANQTTGGSNSGTKAVTEHTVKKGETLSSISRTYFGSSAYAKTIAAYNHLSDGDAVQAGDVLKIPPK